MKAEYLEVEFENAQLWKAWLDAHYADTDGVWLRMYKKASSIMSVTYADALDEALCYGWIDGQMKKKDDVSYIQKFTPRRKNSMWSKRNIEYVARLEAAGRMTPAGLSEVFRAKEDGRWDQAYDKPSEMVAPDYFLDALKKNPQALEFYGTLNKTNTYAIAWRLQTAKTEQTRNRRTERLLEMLAQGKKLH
ncbi:MAG TPA: YdeI/OmpD-associated family protein [Candidatus Saccharimonadales bacterium]|jgi:uncharacterized protein YdeI (YjbR/CyaY-like superfamily)